MVASAQRSIPPSPDIIAIGHSKLDCNIASENTTVCDEVTYVCLTILIAKKIRRSAPECANSLAEGKQRVQKADTMDANKLAVDPATAKPHAKPSELRNTRPIMTFLFRRRNSESLKALLSEKAPLPTAPTAFTRKETIAILWGIAANSPEDTRGDLSVQIRACRMMYCTLGYRPALQRLSEIANVDAVRTKGHRRDQEVAMELLTSLLCSTESVGKQGIQ